LIESHVIQNNVPVCINNMKINIDTLLWNRNLKCTVYHQKRRQFVRSFKKGVVSSYLVSGLYSSSKTLFPPRPSMNMIFSPSLDILYQFLLLCTSFCRFCLFCFTGPYNPATLLTFLSHLFSMSAFPFHIFPQLTSANISPISPQGGKMNFPKYLLYL
jgi:hypothetical protein